MTEIRPKSISDILPPQSDTLNKVSKSSVVDSVTQNADAAIANLQVIAARDQSVRDIDSAEKLGSSISDEIKAGSARPTNNLDPARVEALLRS